MGYREEYFKYHKGYNGYYQCVCCGRWFPKSQIDVDHRISKRMGGTDDIWNLQAMCRHCNRSKNKNSSDDEIKQTVISAGINGLAEEGIEGAIDNLKDIGVSMAKRKIADLLNIDYKRD